MTDLEDDGIVVVGGPVRPPTVMPAAQLPHRRSLRLKTHNYAEIGAYFVTVVVEGRSCLLADLEADDVRLTEIGQMAAEEWRALECRFPGVRLDTFVVMPNHLHAVVWLESVTVGAPFVGALGERATTRVGERATTRVAPTTLGAVVGAYKSLTTCRYLGGIARHGWPRLSRRLWQRNYYDHVIRDETDLGRIRQYIQENPLRWSDDEDNPAKFCKSR